MKYLSVIVPCYNSENYMNKCIDSVLEAKNDVEIIIIDDGSSDNTGKIADEYLKLYPDVIKVIHQENSGHGEGINRGLENSGGLFFKVVDSDDWLDKTALMHLINEIKKDVSSTDIPDMYICNYVYEHSTDNSTYVMRYNNVFPENKIISWSDTKRFKPSQCLMMHSVVFRTEFLKETFIPLPKHTFFEDNLFMYRPLPFAKKLKYLNIDLYRYFIGREDQSVNEKMMIKRINQQINITSLMINSHDLKAVKSENPKLYKYMIHNIAIMMLINASFSFVSKDNEKIKNYYSFCKKLKSDNSFIYKKLMFTTPAIFANIRGLAGRSMFILGYRFARKIIKFG